VGSLCVSVHRTNKDDILVRRIDLMPDIQMTYTGSNVVEPASCSSLVTVALGVRYAPESGRAFTKRDPAMIWSMVTPSNF
jgi:hypothetical protein